MPNPKPKRYKEGEFKKSAPVPDGEELSKQPICVKLPKSVDERLRSMESGTRTTLLRQIICDWARNNPIDA